MNKEGVNRYNELLILYLNDFVDNIAQSSDIKERSIIDATEKLEELLIEYNITIDKNLVKQVIDNSFPMYSNLLKTSFDHAGIHRIDGNLSMSETAKDMNDVTTNLSKAVTEANKIPEYLELIQKIKGTITYLISQTNSNYIGKEYEVDQILNDVIGTFYSIYTDDIINAFLRDKLPELYKICDEISFANDQTEDDINAANPNEERDQFINETMDVEIHEGFKDGKVTLSITDSMGQRTDLIGNAAIEKLKSYNQLYESSRPGKKADTSNWPEDNYVDIPTDNKMEVDLSAPINENTIEIKPIPNQVMDPTPVEEQVPQQVQQPEQSYSDDFNNLTTPSGIEEQEEMSTNENEEMIKNFLNQYKNDTLSTPDISYNEQTTNDLSNLTVPINNLEQPVNEEVPAEPETFTENYTEKTNTFIPTYEDNTPPRTSFGDEFIGNYSNPNYDRDQFIKLTTGIEIQEDVDHRGKLFLRVIEPTGREVIYSGKEAVRMIENYNQTYLDANPDKKVDTTLIDNFKE